MKPNLANDDDDTTAQLLTAPYGGDRERPSGIPHPFLFGPLHNSAPDVSAPTSVAYNVSHDI